MTILQNLWRYWKWLCVALLTTTLVLFLVATVLTNFKPFGDDDAAATECVDSGGTWNADTRACERAG